MKTPKTTAVAKRSEWLMATVDQLNRELGRGTIQLGLPPAGNAWALRVKHRTPRYTTRWDESVNVKL